MTYAIIVVVLLALCLLLSVDNSWMNVLQQMRNNVVFANHNKEYGAFELRKDYNRRLGVSLIIAISFLCVAVGAPYVISKFSKEDLAEKKKKIVEVNLDLFEEKPEEPPPPPEVIPPEQPKIETVQFVAVEAADEPVNEPPPTQNDLQETTAGETTQEGEKIDAPPPPPVEDVVYDIASVQELPSLPGLGEFLKKNLKYPDMEAEAGISGKVYVEFTVDKDGTIKDVAVKKGLSPGLDQEAVRVVRAMPRWEPAKAGGHAVTCRLVQPIKFTLE